MKQTYILLASTTASVTGMLLILFLLGMNTPFARASEVCGSISSASPSGSTTASAPCITGATADASGAHAAGTSGSSGPFGNTSVTSNATATPAYTDASGTSQSNTGLGSSSLVSNAEANPNTVGSGASLSSGPYGTSHANSIAGTVQSPTVGGTVQNQPTITGTVQNPKPSSPSNTITGTVESPTTGGGNGPVQNYSYPENPYTQQRPPQQQHQPTQTRPQTPPRVMGDETNIPNVPNTGAGGDVAMTLTILAGSALIAGAAMRKLRM